MGLALNNILLTFFLAHLCRLFTACPMDIEVLCTEAEKSDLIKLYVLVVSSLTRSQNKQAV